jgi:pSer/pThr/pTyr-binding forkhead associated (FHA) protein
MGLDGGGAPCLVVLSPEPDRGRRIPLTGRLVVGRERGCDVRFDDLGVSRTHAVVQRHGGAVYVEDLGSTGGTFVNGAATTGLRELRSGDVLTFASVTARLEGGPASLASVDDTSTMVHPRPASPRQHQEPQRPRQDRAAATRTRARWLGWTGLVLFLVGSGTFAAADVSFLQHLGDAIRHGTEPSAVGLSGRELGGVPLGLADGALAVVGLILLLAGIVLRLVAAAQRRRAGRELTARPCGPVAPARAARFG